MVQILPPETNLGAQLGQSLGQGLQTGLTQSLQQQYQRGQLQQALSGLENIDTSKMTQPQLVSAYSKALLGFPGGDLALAKILPVALQMQRAQATPTVENIKGGSNISNALFGGNQQSLPSFLEGTQYQQSPNQVNPQAPQPSPVFPKGEGIQLSSYLPYNLRDQITPDQRASVLDQVKRAGGDVDFARQQMDDYNAGKISQIDLANANVEKQAAQVQRQFQLENQIKQKLDEQLPEGISPSRKNLYYNLVNKELPNHKDFTSAFQKVSKKIFDFEKNEKNFIKSIPDSGMYGLTETQRKSLRQSAKPLLETDPLAYNILEEAMTSKVDENGNKVPTNSIVDVSKTLKPLPPQIQNIVSTAGDYRKSVYPKQPMSDRQMLNNITITQSEQSKEIPSLVKKLSKTWNEDISLINLYTDLSIKGWYPEQIKDLLDKLSNNFSSQQQSERTQLNQHPRIPVGYIFESK